MIEAAGILLGCCAALIPFLPGAWGLCAAAALAAVPVCGWILIEPNRWVGCFIFAALLLPPLPIALGNSGPHPSLIFAGLGLFAGSMRISGWRFRPDGLTLSFGLLFFALLISVGFAAIYSGLAVAANSLARVLLFGIGVYVFFFATQERQDVSRYLRLLYAAAVAAAVLACIDFHYQLQAPAGFGPQFVWLATGVYRRAQGMFYEASTLGNFCAFFLVMIAVAMSSPRDESPISRFALYTGAAVFTAALIFSYSRASVLTVAIAVIVLLCMNRRHVRLWTLVSSIAAGAIASYWLFPSFLNLYSRRLSASALDFFQYTEGILSGRLESWRVLAHFLLENPWRVIFGTGYKTLPYTDIAGRAVIADNMYLSALVETGIFGLAALLILTIAILRASYRAGRSTSPKTAFFGRWIFCFWCGEAVQMLSGDLLTYWRVLPVYFLVMGWMAREHSLS